MTDRQTLTITVWAKTEDEVSINLQDLSDWIAERLAEVPPEYRDEAWFAADTEYESGYISAGVYYQRPETDEELAARVEKHRADAKEQAAYREAQERAQYERLKAKFGA